jgi:hypothetical protein
LLIVVIILKVLVKLSLVTSKVKPVINRRFSIENKLGSGNAFLHKYWEISNFLFKMLFILFQAEG